MPYIKVDELPEGYEGESYDEIVTIEERDTLVSERDEARAQRDEAIGRAETAQADATAAREKYANAFLTTREDAKDRYREEPKYPTRVDDLF